MDCSCYFLLDLGAVAGGGTVLDSSWRWPLGRDLRWGGGGGVGMLNLVGTAFHTSLCLDSTFINCECSKCSAQTGKGHSSCSCTDTPSLNLFPQQIRPPWVLDPFSTSAIVDRALFYYLMGFAVRVRSAGQKYGPTCHQRDRADVTEFVTLVRLSSLGQHVGVLALAGYKRRKFRSDGGPYKRVSCCWQSIRIAGPWGGPIILLLFSKFSHSPLTPSLTPANRLDNNKETQPF